MSDTAEYLRARWRQRALIGALAALVATLSVLPILRLLIEALIRDGALSLQILHAGLAREDTWIAFRHSMETAIGGTLVALAIGVTVALLATLCDIRIRGAFVFCFVLPLMVAPQVMALAWLQISGPSSPLLKMIGLAPPLGAPNPLYSREGIILLLGVQYAPLIFLTLSAGLRALPRELVEASLASGAGKFATLRNVILPLMTPPLVAGLALCFVSCIGNFGIPAFLGVPGRYIVLPTLIYQRLAAGGVASLGDVAVLSLLIGAVAMAGIFVQDAMLRARDYRIVSSQPLARSFPLGRWRLPVETALWAMVALFLVIPFIGLVMTALAPAYGVKLTLANATLDNFRFVLFEHDGSRRAFRNSFALAGGAALLLALASILIGYFVVWRRSGLLRRLNLVAELPYALPGVVLSIAAILLFLKPVPVLGLSIYNTVWIIFFAYLARFLALALRPVVSAYHQTDRALEEAAQIAGAGFFFRLRTVVAPLVAPAAGAGALLVFLTAFSELTVSALLWSSGAETIGVVIFSFEQGGDSGYAAAISVLAILVTLTILLALAALGARLPKGTLPWRD